MFFTSQISEVILPHAFFCYMRKMFVGVVVVGNVWIDTRFCSFTVWLTWTLCSLLASQRKGGRTHRPRVSANERRWLYFWGIQVRESTLASGAPPPVPRELSFSFFFFTHKPLPCPALPRPRPRQLSAQTCSVSLCLGWSSAFFFLTFAADETLTRKQQMTTSEYCKVSHIWTPATAKHKNFGLGTGTPFMLFPPVGLYVCVYACVCRHFVVSFEKQEFFTFQRIYGFRCGLQTLYRTVRKKTRGYISSIHSQAHCD